MEQKITLKKATIINALPKYFNLLFFFVVNIVLARLLTPNDYGIVAVVNVFTAFFSLFADLGFGSAYIQNKDATVEDRNNLFSFMCYVGLALFVLFFGFSYCIAWFYENSVYVYVGWALGVGICFSAIMSIPYSDLLKKEKFWTVGIVTVFDTIISAGFAILFAYLGFSYWAIVLQTLISGVFYDVVYIWIVKPSFHFRIEWGRIKKFSRFSSGYLGFACINYFSRNLDDLLIGKTFDSTNVGYYDKAYKTSTYPVYYFSSVIGSSILPVLAKAQDEKEYIYQKFKTLLLFLLTVGFYVSLILHFASKEIVLLLYGDQWVAAIPVLSILAFGLWSQMSCNISGAFYQTLGNTKIMFIEGVVSTFLTATGAIVGVLLGKIEYVAMGHMVAQCLDFFVVLFFIQHFLFKKSPWEILSHFLLLLVCFAFSFAACYFIFAYVSFENLWISSLFKFFVSLFFYCFFVFLFRQTKPIKDVIGKKKEKTSDENKVL